MKTNLIAQASLFVLFSAICFQGHAIPSEKEYTVGNCPSQENTGIDGLQGLAIKVTGITKVEVNGANGQATISSGAIILQDITRNEVVRATIPENLAGTYHIERDADDDTSKKWVTFAIPLSAEEAQKHNLVDGQITVSFYPGMDFISSNFMNQNRTAKCEIGKKK